MRNKILVSLLLIGLLTLTACNLIRVPAGTTGTTGDPVHDQETLVALAVLQTAAAGGGGGAPPPETAATFTPSLTSTITWTPTPSVPMVTVSVETNCRTGPGSPYDILGGLPVGVPAEVVGRNASGDTWIIKLPSNPAITCWLWGQYATVVGDTSGLPIFSPPPTPTPAAGFSVTYLGNPECPPLYGVRFQLVNTGSITWESYRLVVYDSDTSTTKTTLYDTFDDWTDGCVLANSLDNLEPGEVGIAGNWGPGVFNYDLSGNNMTATFKLCSQEGQAGTCVEKSISFTP